MPTPKNPKPRATSGANELLAVLTEPAAAVTAIVSPVEPVTPVAEVDEPRLAVAEEEPSVADLFKALIDGLGADINQVAGVDIRRPGVIRLLGTDRGLRSRRFEWPKIWEVAE